MADKKITELTEDTAPTYDDLVATVNDPSGTPATKKSKLSSIFAAMQTWVFGVDAGANDTYTATLSPAPAAYVTGQSYRFKANTANTGACTINFNGLGAKTIKKAPGGVTTDLDDNDIRAGQWVDLVYDGTNMQMQSNLGNTVTTAAPSGSASGDLSGSYPSPTVIQASGAFALTGDISPAQITANQNDLSPTGAGTSSVWRLDFDATLRNITGVAGGADGRVLLVGNVGSNYGLIKHQDTGSSAANRFILPNASDLAVWPDETFIFIYDATTSRWRLVGTTPSTISPPFETLTDGATITWDFHGRRMRNATVTLGGNRTLAFSNVPNGATGLLVVKQDGTGSRTLTLPASSKVVGGGSGAITLTTTASGIDIISFYYDGTSYLWTYGKNFS